MNKDKKYWDLGFRQHAKVSEYPENYRLLDKELDFRNRGLFIQSLAKLSGFNNEETETFLWVLTMWDKKRVIPIGQSNIENIQLVGDNPECNWPEDYDKENGHYHCKCVKCEKIFYGNKHRVVCKICSCTT